MDVFGLADRETFSAEYLIANVAPGLLLLKNRLAYPTAATDKYQRTKVSSNTTNHRAITCKKNNIWQCQANNIPNMALSKLKTNTENPGEH